nr:MAG TPA: hypothetical protein [Caudoviricetes sp.]
MFNKDITIINKWFNKETKKDEYKINHVKGFWSSNEGISISGTQLVKNDGVIVRILMSEQGYHSLKEFKENGIGWTLQNDDYIVKGLIDKVETLTKLKSEYDDVMKITKISIKDYGSLDMQHFEVSGE